MSDADGRVQQPTAAGQPPTAKSRQPAPKHGSVLVVGGGIGGIQASLDLADQGFKVYLVERNPSIGGTMAQLDKTFPTNDCAMCMISPKLVGCGRHPNIEILTLAQVREVAGQPGNFRVLVRQEPRSIDIAKCTGCGTCLEECPVRNVVRVPPAPPPLEPLPAEEESFLAGVLAELADEPGALLPVLQRINARFRYLPRRMLEHAAYRLGLSLAHVIRVATFYNAFSLVPVGRHIVEACSGTACHVRGSARLIRQLASDLRIAPGETTGDGRFTFRTVNCIGCCALSPALRVDGKVFPQVKAAQLPKILRDFA
jgi:NADH:ubiquinone oxidoreductase subunit E